MQLCFLGLVLCLGVDTLGNEGRCSIAYRDNYLGGGVDTLGNEGRCSVKL